MCVRGICNAATAWAHRTWMPGGSFRGAKAQVFEVSNFATNLLYEVLHENAYQSSIKAKNQRKTQPGQ